MEGMTMPDQPQGFDALSDHELRSFAEKLEAWGKNLSPREQSFLLQILGRASADGDTQGYISDDFRALETRKGTIWKRPLIESALFRVNSFLPSLEHRAPLDPTTI
jgi:hypothetical protein